MAITATAASSTSRRSRGEGMLVCRGVRRACYLAPTGHVALRVWRCAMTTRVRILAAGTLMLACFGTEPTSAQCPAFSSVTFQSYGNPCPPVPSCLGNTSLYGFYGPCSVSLALFGSTFVGVGLGSQATQGIPVALNGVSCSLWISPPYVILDFAGQGLSQLVFT